MKKQRHYQRYIVTGNGHILNSKLRKAEILINDISASGMNLTTDIELEEQEAVAIDIIISGSFMPYSKLFKGIVMRKRRNKSFYHYAVRFVELTHKDIIDVDEYLRFNQSSSKLQHFTDNIRNGDITSSS